MCGAALSVGTILNDSPARATPAPPDCTALKEYAARANSDGASLPPSLEGHAKRASVLECNPPNRHQLIVAIKKPPFKMLAGFHRTHTRGRTGHNNIAVVQGRERV